MLALVTGGLSKLGWAIAARLAEAGYDLALHVRADRPLERERAEALERQDRAYAILPADLADMAALDGLIDHVAARFGRAPDCLVNSASMLSEGGWDAIEMDALVDHFRVNTAAPLVLTRRFAAALPAGVSGTVINIADQRVRNPTIDQAAYTVSKLALAAATRAMARAFAPAVRINAVAPGLTIPGPEYAEGQIGRLTEQMPLGRLPRAEEVADAVLYLARAESVTGQVLFVDGGAALESYRRDFVHMGRDPLN